MTREQIKQEWKNKLDDGYLNEIIGRASDGTLSLDTFINRNAGIEYLIRVLSLIED